MLKQNEDLVEFNAVGAESEEDVSAGLAQQVSKAVLWSTDWTIETIQRQLEKGNIELNPAFQRREAWNDTKKSLFIESVFLGFPIPQIVLAERKDKPGAYIVIDGKQRLLSIRRFCAKKNDPDFRPFSLTGLNIKTLFNDQTFEDLSANPTIQADIRLFENQTFRTTVIRNWPTENFLYTVFLRLNTGSVPLSPQELRQALHPGPFLTYADKFTQQSNVIPTLLGRTTPDFRMRDVELFVRYFAFRKFLEKYRGNLKEFLDEACKTLNSEWSAVQTECEDAAARLELAIQATMQIFGPEQAFRKWSPEGYEGRFNRAVFDVMVYFFSDLKPITIKSHAAKIKTAYERLCEKDSEFVRSIESTTKSLQATSMRLEKWGLQLQKVLRVKLKIPRFSNGKIVRN